MNWLRSSWPLNRFVSIKSKAPSSILRTFYSRFICWMYRFRFTTKSSINFQSFFNRFSIFWHLKFYSTILQNFSTFLSVCFVLLSKAAQLFIILLKTWKYLLMFFERSICPLIPPKKFSLYFYSLGFFRRKKVSIWPLCRFVRRSVLFSTLCLWFHVLF